MVGAAHSQHEGEFELGEINARLDQYSQNSREETRGQAFEATLNVQHICYY